MAVLEIISDAELKKIHTLGYYPGSFDPLHQGHMEVIKIILKEKLCDYIFIYCVNGTGSYKQRSNFFERTKICESYFGSSENVLISYMSPVEIQQKLTYEKNGLAVSKFAKKITGIIGSDIATKLEEKSKNEKLEKIRIERQKDFMQGCIVSDDVNSIFCSTCLPAIDFIVALRNNDSINEVSGAICDRKVRAVIDTKKFRFISSSRIKGT